MLITIVVPVYNVADYLDACLNSLRGQSYKNLEIIAVNDASPDRCADILTQHATKDERIKIITHEKNQGLGAARNSGMQIARGAYIYFLDSDDLIAPDTIQTLVEYVEKMPADMVQFRVLTFEKDPRVTRINPYFIPMECKHAHDYDYNTDCQKMLREKPTYYLYFYGHVIFMGNKMLRTDFARRYLFAPRVAFEDLPVHYAYVLNAKSRLCICDERACIYYRVNREGSIMKSATKQTKLALQIIESTRLGVQVFRDKGTYWYAYGIAIQLWTFFYHIASARNREIQRKLAREMLRVLWSVRYPFGITYIALLRISFASLYYKLNNSVHYFFPRAARFSFLTPALFIGAFIILAYKKTIKILGFASVEKSSKK